MVFQDILDYRKGDIPELPGLTACRLKPYIPLLSGKLKYTHAGTIRRLFHLTLGKQGIYDKKRVGAY